MPAQLRLPSWDRLTRELDVTDLDARQCSKAIAIIKIKITWPRWRWLGDGKLTKLHDPELLVEPGQNKNGDISMIRKFASAAVIVLYSTSITMAVEPIKDDEMCKARLKTHEAMLQESDTGEKTDALVSDLLKVFDHLCETKEYDETLRVGNTIRGLLATDD